MQHACSWILLVLTSHRETRFLLAEICEDENASCQAHYFDCKNFGMEIDDRRSRWITRSNVTKLYGLEFTEMPLRLNYMDSEGVQSLQSALFQPISANQALVDPNTILNYTNIFDWEVDDAYTAMSELNVTRVPVLVTEIGWPSDGDSSEFDATALNADTYNANLITHILNGNGNPAHPGAPVNTYIYKLFNEDLRAGPKSERNWGIFNGNSTAIYNLRFDDFSSTMLANATFGSRGGNGVYCVAIANTDDGSLQVGLDWACGLSGADCQAIQPGSRCYNPNTLQAHASYTF